MKFTRGKGKAPSTQDTAGDVLITIRLKGKEGRGNIKTTIPVAGARVSDVTKCVEVALFSDDDGPGARAPRARN